jgi:hypothetical protein
MLYYHCKIGTYNILRNLTCGDIVVFGSKLAGNFVVDTVFVVADQVSVEDPALCQLFAQANGGHFPGGPRDVYRGATFANPVDGMFSFFPAFPCADRTPMPFPRPTLQLLTYPGLINQNLGRGLKHTTIPNSQPVWLQIVSEITRQGKVLGLRA